MIFETPNPARISLQCTAIKADGTPKTDVVSGTVRVYHLGSGGETQDLASTPLVFVSGSTWRYVWEPVSLAAGQYVVHYELSDASADYPMEEDLVVRDLAQETSLTAVADDAKIARQGVTNRMRSLWSEMTIYDDDAVAVVAEFDLLNSSGGPAATMDDVVERVPK